MPLFSLEALDARRAIAADAFAPLAASLAAGLEPLFAREPYIPAEKALLSRAGGRCEVDGTALVFDPFSPDAHRCLRCNRRYSGEIHRRAWIYPYQLWLAERALHAALLGVLQRSERHIGLARDILLGYARAYAAYPNSDNVLGPSRPFFSTYLESIWVLQLCVATGLLRDAGETQNADVVVEHIIEPSAAIVASYDEGFSNRQVWNNAAMLAAALLMGDAARASAIVHGRSGLAAHLAEGLLEDGSWYEGENYHLFAHRGLWYGVTMAGHAGIAIRTTLLERFDEGFAFPLATALPDLTLPSRKDSQYAISIRQPRFAESFELGLARRDDARLATALTRLYEPDIPRGDTGRDTSTADVERNLPATSLTRADLGWRALAFARRALAAGTAEPMRSAHLEGQGISVFRRDRGRVYVALDWGQTGGGHGHPDRLNLTFARDTRRVLDDLGTGSYVDPSLHWYRSTLAHNAPLINGSSQQRVSGRVVAYDERGGVGWILAAVDGIAEGVTVDRAIIVTPDYFVDEITWRSKHRVRFELPIHFDADANVDLAASEFDGGTGTEDGFAFAQSVRGTPVEAGRVIALRRHDAMRAWVCADGASHWFEAAGPGQPASESRRFHVIRCHGTHGAIRSVWTWTPRVDEVSVAGDSLHITMGAEQHSHRRTDEYWQLEMTVGHAQSGIELFGWRERTPRAPTVPPPRRERPIDLTLRRDGEPVTVDLGRDHYRQSELSWEEAGAPTAFLTLSVRRDELDVRVRVRTPHIVFVPADAVNPLDNEHPDINGHGIQCYVRLRDDGNAWMIVPERAASQPRVRSIEGWGTLQLGAREWRATDEGFEIRFAIPLQQHRSIDFDLIVNDAVTARMRRRGQLVLSGGRGEFVFLRGDRHTPDALLHIGIA